MNIIIANRSQLLSTGIRMAVTSIFNDVSLAETNSVSHLIEMLACKHQQAWQVLLIDQALLESIGLKQLRALSPNTKVCLMPPSYKSHPCCFQSIKGLDDILSEHPSSEELKQAIDILVFKQIHFSCEIKKPTAATKYGGGKSTQKTITPRQQEVLVLMARGLRNKEIAHRLNLTEGTVKRHLSDSFKSLNVHNRVEAARISENLGLLVKNFIV